jgi:anti-sigma B factor antagonist
VPAALDVERPDPDASVVRLVGEHDISVSTDLVAALTGEAERAIVVELSLATFIDSSILAVLLGGLRRAEAAGRGFAFVVNEGNVNRALTIANLLTIFPTYPTVAEALAAARAGVNTPVARAKPASS